MNDSQLHYFQKLLQEKQEQLEETLKTLVDSARPVDLNTPQGRLSRMDAIEKQQMNLHGKKQAEQLVLQIGSALERIKSGDYGICLKCEEEISDKRLRAKPEAPFCLNCQQG